MSISCQIEYLTKMSKLYVYYGNTYCLIPYSYSYNFIYNFTVINLLNIIKYVNYSYNYLRLVKFKLLDILLKKI